MILYFDPFSAPATVVQLSAEDDFGLYCSGRRNELGTMLAARGTRAEIVQLVEDRLPRLIAPIPERHASRS